MAMNSRAFPEMLHCMSTRANVAGVKGMEMSVLERQNMVLKRQQDQLLQVQQQHQQEEMSCFNELGMLSFLSAQAQDYQQTMNVECGPSPVTAGAALCELMNRPIKVDPSMETGWMDFGMQSSAVTVENSGVESVGQVNSPCYGMNYAISRTASCPPVVPLVTPAAMTTAHSEARARESLIAEQKLSAAIGRESFKKRKAEKNLMTPKAVETEKDSRSKKRKGSAEEEESKITEQHSNCSQNKQKDSDGTISEKKNKETLGCSSKDDSKASEIQKPDYIHVRARRGQATDSHSLAERVRREKISERMRYLQDLVPGCNKITGKAGMLDEIINYVQSLQRQVEFLSMKLATVNPRLDFNIDDLIAKQVLAACSSSLATMGVSPDLANPNYLQYSPIQQVDPDCGSELVANQIDMGLRRSISAPVSIPETLFDISCFNQLANSIQWDVDVQNMYNLESQGRSTEFPYQTFTGIIDSSSLKMEM